MTPATERFIAPEIDSAAFTTAIAAYQRYRRVLESVHARRSAGAGSIDVAREGIRPGAGVEALHEARIARARLRHVVARFVAQAVQADIPKSSLVRQVHNHLKTLVRSAIIEPDASLVSELIEFIAEGYPDDILAARGRPTPVRGRDVIPLQLLSPTERVS